jgi:hypothetical protein
VYCMRGSKCRVRGPGVLSSQARGECCRYRTQFQPVVEGVLACRGRVVRGAARWV